MAPEAIARWEPAGVGKRLTLTLRRVLTGTGIHLIVDSTGLSMEGEGDRPRRTIRQVQQVGRRQWKKDSGYHRQARMENAFFRYKSIIGESLRGRSRAGQETEALLACNILNQMTQLGRPASYAIGR